MISAQLPKSCCPEAVQPHRSEFGAGRTVERNPLPIWKRALDIGFLLLISPALVPVMTIIALFIKLSSRGPVLFRQERIGLYGESFVCFKFRTMRPGAETNSHQQYLANLIGSSTPMQKLDHVDNRIIPFGTVIRASGLDELPQIFNVLRGEMSMVGPRPCIRYEYEKFTVEDRQRFDAVPGLTGLWQVSGKNDTTFREMIDLDIDYAHNLSLGRDLSIIFRTLPVLFDQVGRVLKRKFARSKTI